MRKLLIIILALTIPLGIVYAYSFGGSETDELVVALRDNSFLPIKPASTLHTVGALYFIEPDLSKFSVICSAPKELLDKYTHRSPGAAIGGNRILRGTYTSQIKAKPDQLINGKGSIDNEKSIRVHYELRDVNLLEIEIGSSSEVYDQLMKIESCQKSVTKYLNVSGYICQDLGLFVASAAFNLDSDVDTGASLDLDTQQALASRIEAETNVRLTNTEGRSVAGQGLQWGIQMARLCVTPNTARFQRTLPRNTADMILNFIKFNILEPILPAS